jgi:hypothetical protein
MVARCWQNPEALYVTFEREGDEPVHIRAANGEKAVLEAVKALLLVSRLKAGDRIVVSRFDGARP